MNEIVFNNGVDHPAMTFLHSDRTFQLNLSQGHYFLDRQMLHGYLVRRLDLDGRDVLDEGFSVTGPGKLSLEITLSKDGGRIDGVVIDQDGKAVAGAMVVLVPDSAHRSRLDLFQNVDEEVDDQVWQDPDSLRARASRLVSGSPREKLRVLLRSEDLASKAGESARCRIHFQRPAAAPRVAWEGWGSISRREERRAEARRARRKRLPRYVR